VRGACLRGRTDRPVQGAICEHVRWSTPPRPSCACPCHQNANTDKIGTQSQPFACSRLQNIRLRIHHVGTPNHLQSCLQRVRMVLCVCVRGLGCAYLGQSLSLVLTFSITRAHRFTGLPPHACALSLMLVRALDCFCGMHLWTLLSPRASARAC